MEQVVSISSDANKTKVPVRHLAAFIVALMMAFLLASPSRVVFADEIDSQDASGITARSITAAGGEITVPARVTSYQETSLTASVTYDPSFEKGQKTRFTFNVPETGKSRLYKLNAFQVQTASGWSSIVDTSRTDLFGFSENNYFEEEVSAPGNYQLSFYVWEYATNEDGSPVYDAYVRFQIEFTVAESGDFKSIDTIISEVVAECESSCAATGDTSEYAKALWLNDWIIDHTEYDSTLTYMSAEGVFSRGKGTCEAYHEAYTMLLNKAGIETKRVESRGDAHVWTGVKLDGNWYNVDTTWNDGAPLNSYFPDVRHLYFAVPTSIMQATHKQWKGDYYIGPNESAPFDASSYEDNYFIRSGKLSEYIQPYLEADGAYSVNTHLAAHEGEFTISAERNWPDNYKEVIYRLVAFELAARDWGNNTKVAADYFDGALHFSATYDESDSSSGEGEDPKPIDPIPDEDFGPGSSDSPGDNTDPGSDGSTDSAPGIDEGDASQGDSAPAITGVWKKKAGKWWFAYDADTQATQNKAWPVDEWVTIDGKRYHFDSKGYMSTKWFWSGSHWYWLGTDGALKTGWAKVSGKWYFMDANGIMQTGKRDIEGKTYFLAGSGAMKTGWNSEQDGWYYYTSSGAMAKGWAKVKDKWYYLDPANGLMKTSFYDVEGARYYSSDSGAMQTGWKKLDGNWYYFDKSGAMQKNKWISGKYWVGEDGAMAADEWVDNGRYYVDKNGKWVRGAQH